MEERCRDIYGKRKIWSNSFLSEANSRSVASRRKECKWQERDRIAAAMGIELARPAAASGGAAKPKAKKSDALDSYQHLIDEVGY